MNSKVLKTKLAFLVFDQRYLLSAAALATILLVSSLQWALPLKLSLAFLLAFLLANLIWKQILIRALPKIFLRPGSRKPASISVPDLLEQINLLSDQHEQLQLRYQALTQSLTAAICMQNAEGRILYCSPYTEVLTGYSLVEIEGYAENFFEQIAHADDLPRLKRALEVSKLGEPFKYQYRFFHKKNLELWAETLSVPILDTHGEVESILTITFDITSSVNHKRKVEEQNQDLKDFTYMVSHDLKGPIFTLQGMLGIIRTDCPEIPTPLQVPLQHIENAARRLEILVQGVLEYSRISSLKKQQEEVNLNQVLKDLHKDLQPQLDKYGIQINYKSDCPAVLGDTLFYYQIFSNLLQNAIKYRQPERPLVINISNFSEAVTHTLNITVSDNGLGIPAARIQDVFRPFQRAHGNIVEGSGVGLACVKKLIERMGGSISVSSTEGEGTTFTLKIRTVEVV